VQSAISLRARASDIPLPHISTLLQPPSALWLSRRPTISQSSATVPIGIRLSSMPVSALLNTNPGFNPRRPSSERARGASGALLDDAFADAFTAQVKDATGRDLNSFRWIDSPADDDRDSDSQETDDDINLEGFEMIREEDVSPISPLSGGSRTVRTVSPSIYPDEERNEEQTRSSGWI
jgi:hypothetical protein